MSEPSDLNSWAKLLKENWEKRSRSDSRDFFVASHPGWQDEETVRRKAKTELDLVLANLDSKFLSQKQVLEIGCGPGRLAQYVGPRVLGYTGIDIAEGMIQGAHERCHHIENCRFFVCDGISVPQEARDRLYHLAYAIAVFIHCPRDVIKSMVGSAWALIEPCGELRFQVLADPSDPTGIVAPETTEIVRAEVETIAQEMNDEERQLTETCYYLGDRFRYDEVIPFFERLPDSKVSLYRSDIGAIYGRIEKGQGVASRHSSMEAERGLVHDRAKR